jgi:predicted secreted protein
VQRLLPLLLLWFGLTAWLPQAYAADEGPTHNLISLAVEASGDVDNDVLVGMLGLTAEGSQASGPADEVNDAMNWAIAQAKAMPELKVQTQSYQTAPIYRDNSLRGWRVSQSLRLESRDALAMSKLIATLQSRLALQSLAFEVSDENRRRAEQDLISAALARFTERAKLITGELGRSSYRLVRLDVNSGGGVPPRPMMRAMAMEAEAVAAPRIEAGTQRLSVTINGTIEVTED